MRDVFIKLRVKCFVCRLSLQSLVAKITVPFQIAIGFLKRCWAFRKINKESNDRWEKYVKCSNLAEKAKLVLRRNQFTTLIVQLMGTFTRTCMCATCYVALQEQPNEVDNSRVDEFRQEFQELKDELVGLLKKLCDYDEITFDEGIKSRIISWEFETLKTRKELGNWSNSISKYIYTLDIFNAS